MGAEHPLRDHALKSAIDWFCRPSTIYSNLIRGGVAVLVATLGLGLLLEVKIPISGGSTLDLKIDTSGGTPALILYGCSTIGILMILTGAILWIVHSVAESRLLNRKRIIVIEERGLRDTTDTPLEKAVPAKFKGHRDNILVNLRQGVDGQIVVPAAALDRISALPQQLELRRAGRDRADISVVYGGLVSVPFAFLTGLLIDDESLVTIFDWDRNKSQWRELDADDDGVRFSVSGLAEIPAGAQEAILAVAVSYNLDLEGIRQTLGPLPMVRCDLPNGTPDCHWSEEKQQALSRQFRETVTALSNVGVQKVHVFLAAQNSISFRFGKSIDKRNLPPVIVYQYERSSVPPYPWGVLMPVHGIDRPQIIKTAPEQ